VKLCRAERGLSRALNRGPWEPLAASLGKDWQHDVVYGATHHQRRAKDKPYRNQLARRIDAVASFKRPANLEPRALWRIREAAERMQFGLRPDDEVAATDHRELRERSKARERSERRPLSGTMPHAQGCALDATSGEEVQSTPPAP
jgi:hypothetical protein